MAHSNAEGTSPNRSPETYAQSTFSDDTSDTPIQYTSFQATVSEAFDRLNRERSRSPMSRKANGVNLQAPTPARLHPSHFEEATPLVSNRSFLTQMRGIHRPETPSGTYQVESPKRTSRPNGTSINIDSGGECSIRESSTTIPQHLLVDPKAKNFYYRVVYRGIVSLLATPSVNGSRNGSYLSYGDIFESSWCSELANESESIAGEPLQLKPRLEVKEEMHGTLPQKHPPTMPSLQRSLKRESDCRQCIIRVDRVLTRGYSINPGSKTDDKEFTGFLLSRVNEHCIAEKLEIVPEIEERMFVMKVNSSSPVPIFSGPSWDAPKMKAMLLPGTIIEASLRIRVNDGGNEDVGASFLRLSHRRGWLADRRQDCNMPLVSEVSRSFSMADDCDVSIYSSASTMTSASTSSRGPRKHRPPRRRADASIEVPAKHIPRSNSEIGPSGTPDRNSSSYESSLCSKRLTSPLSNLSLLSDESSIDQNTADLRHQTLSPDVSLSTNRSTGSSNSVSASHFYLMRVLSPRGLKILDAPHFQVNNLIHGNMNTMGVVSSSQLGSQMETGLPKKHQSIFQTMSGRLTTTGPSSRTGNPAIFDSGTRTRILPHGVLFEASRRLENSGALNEGEGLIKLSDNSGWAIVPNESDLIEQYRSTYHGLSGLQTGEKRRAFEEVGNASVDETLSLKEENKSSIWIRVEHRSGLPISCPPPMGTFNDGDTSPTSSRGSSSIGGSHAGSHATFGHDSSDVASSVGSSFLDSVFRTPRKNREIEDNHVDNLQPLNHADSASSWMSDTVPCGMCVEVEKWNTTGEACAERQDFARLRGGQGWLPIFSGGKTVSAVIPKPEFRFGSFWFRVKSSRGVKARQGPSRRAPSIRSEDAAHVMRFECGEFLRASEIVTVTSVNGEPTESFAKLYRNRHAHLCRGHEPFRSLISLTTTAEWVPIFTTSEQFLEECAKAPKIERHKQGWRYNVVTKNGVAIRKGPSFASETTGVILRGGEAVIANERVTPGGENIVWLRLRDGQWVHDTDDEGNQVMAAHCLFHRSIPRPNEGRSAHELLERKEAAYNKIVSRLFQGGNEVHKTDLQSAPRFQGM